MKCILRLCFITCLLLASCSASKHDRLLVFTFSNAKAVSQTELDFGKPVAEIIDPITLTAFDECVKASKPTRETKQPVPVANGNWIVICHGNSVATRVALHIFVDGQIGWRYENASVLNGALQIKGNASNQVKCARLAKLVSDRLRPTLPDLVKPYDLLSSGDPFR